MNSIVKLSAFLFIVAAICASLVSGVYDMTLPVINAMQVKSLQESYADVFPDFDVIKKSDRESDYKDVIAINIAQKDNKPVGVIYSVTSKGYAGAIELLVGFDLKSKKITGIKILKQNETPGLGSNCTKLAFTKQFIGKPTTDDLMVIKKGEATDNQIHCITASTITSRAVVDAVNVAREDFAENYK